MTSIRLDRVKSRIVCKPSDETVNNTDVYQDDNHLVFPVGTNQTWIVTYRLFVIGNATADMKVQVTVPAAGTVVGWLTGPRAADAVVTNSVIGAPLGAAATLQGGILEAYVTTAGTAGNVTLQWAQIVATVGDTTMKAGSSLTATRIT